jgi:uracil-DNA glycosylase family 4
VQGFFSSLGRKGGSRAPLATLPACGACKLFLDCRTPKIGVDKVDGEGRRRILVIGEAPGKDEDAAGRPFVGRTGRHLEATLDRLGVDLRRDCWIMNAVACRPRDNKLPPKAVMHCRPNVVSKVRELKPDVILLLGGAAVESLLGWLWKEDVGGATRWAGFRNPNQRLNAWVCPTFHPSFVVREDRENRGGGQDAVKQLMWERHLKKAVSASGPPWQTLPDYKSKIQLIYNPDAAALQVRLYQKRGRLVAVDFETDRLKPDHPDARIYYCAVSDGDTAACFPWQGAAIEAMRELLLSDVPKTAHNQKMEGRWTLKMFGKPVRNWQYCSMIGAHVEDNRRGVTGLKFQAFVKLGVEPWDLVIKPYFQAKGGNARNRIAEAPREKIMEYCALDTLYQYDIAQIQRKRLKIKED